MSFDVPAKGFQSRLEASFTALSRQLEQRGSDAGQSFAPVRPLTDTWRDGAREHLLRYLDLVVTWGRRHDLTAARSADELVDLTLPDAFVLGWFAGEHTSWADVGTGAGAPGLPLKFLRPDLAVTLVEPRTKRVAFLRTVVGQSKLGAIPVLRVRSEELPYRSFDSVVSRAVLAPQPWLEHASTLSRRDIWVLLAQAEVPQLEGYACDVDVSYVWPLTGVSRRALRFRALAA